MLLIVLTILRLSSCEKGPGEKVSEDYGLMVGYYGEEFDKKKNCADEEKMVKLRKNYPDQCFSQNDTEDFQEYPFENCMEEVLLKFEEKCEPLGVKSLGNITYCMQGDTSKCCLPQAECHTELDAQFKSLDKGLTPYVAYGLDTMADFIATKEKYKVCFKTREHESIDICEAECKKLKNSEFAKNCSKKVDGHKGVFKCCKTVGNLGCDICKYCCILPVCKRVKDGEDSNEFDIETITKTNIMDKKIPDDQEALEAKYYYQMEYADEMCVTKRKRGKDLYYYDMDEYKAADTIEDIKNLDKLYDVDRLRFNPTHRLMFTNETGPKKYVEAYQHDYCFKLYKDTKGKRSKCVKQCKKLRTESFAKVCNKKKHSLFKCCITTHNYGESELVQMKTMKTLNETLKRPCANGKCYFCCVTAFCSTFRDGNMYNTFGFEDEDYEPEVNESPVDAPDTCVNPNNNSPDYWPTYNMKEYNTAYTEDMMCRVSLEMSKGVPQKNRRKLPTKRKINKKCDRIKKKRNKRKYSKK